MQITILNGHLAINQNIPLDLSPPSISPLQSLDHLKRFNSENIPLPDPNVQFVDPPLSASLPKLLPMSAAVSAPQELPLKEEIKIIGSDGQSKMLASLDLLVTVVVRIRPVSDHERQYGVTAKKVSLDSVSVGDRSFVFDSVLDSNANQEDVFQLVGVPLVKSALAG